MGRRAGASLEARWLPLAGAALLLAGAALPPCAGPAAAQEAAEAPAAAAPEKAPAPAPPAAWPLAEVTQRAEDTHQQLKEMQRRLASRAEIAQIEERLPAAAALVDDAARETGQRVAGGDLPLRTIADLQRAWVGRRGELAVWRDRLTQRGAQVSRDAERIEELRARWTATREAAVATGTSSALEWIDRALAELAQAEREARERTRALVALQGRVARVEAVISRTLEGLEELREQRRQHLLEPDSAPLWGLRFPESAAAVRDRVLADWRYDWQTLRTFVGARGGHMAAHALLALLVFAGVAALRRRVERLGEGAPDLGDAVHVFRYPVSTALLAWVLSAPWFLPLAPEVVGSAITTVLLVPALLLLPRVVDPPLRPTIYALAGFYLAAQLGEMLASAPLLSRLLLTLELFAAVALLAWMLRPARLARLPTPRALPAFLRLVVRVVFGLAALAFAANLFGYVGFARVLATGLLWSLYAAVIFHGSYRVVRLLVSVALATGLARRLRSVRVAAPRIERWVARLLRIAALLWWLDIALRAFASDDLVYAALRRLVAASVHFGALSLSLGDVLAFGVVVGAAFLLSGFIRFVLEEDVFPRVALRRGVSNAIATTANYAILLVGLIFALAAAGVDLSRVTLLAGAFGVGIGFGLQNVVNNFVSGLILLFERPIQVGDTIEVGGLMGDVRRIGPRSSTVRTFDGAEVIVPNAMLISDQVVNWTLSDRRRRITVAIGVAYGADPERVLEILRETAKGNASVLQDPEPLALFVGFGESSLDFELRCWIPRFEEGFVAQTALRVDLHARLRAAGIEIPFPQRDVHLRSVPRPGSGP